jgi:hypothetical protein
MLVVWHKHQKRDDRTEANDCSEDRTPEKDDEGVPWDIV